MTTAAIELIDWHSSCSLSKTPSRSFPCKYSVPGIIAKDECLGFSHHGTCKFTADLFDKVPAIELNGDSYARLHTYRKCGFQGTLIENTRQRRTSATQPAWLEIPASALFQFRNVRQSLDMSDIRPFWHPSPEYAARWFLAFSGPDLHEDWSPYVSYLSHFLRGGVCSDRYHELRVLARDGLESRPAALNLRIFRPGISTSLTTRRPELSRAVGWPMSFNEGGNPPEHASIVGGNYDLTADLTQSGLPVSGSLKITGTIPGLASSGTLLTGQLQLSQSGFGFQSPQAIQQSGSGDIFEFVFNVTGGDLAPITKAKLALFLMPGVPGSTEVSRQALPPAPT